MQLLVPIKEGFVVTVSYISRNWVVLIHVGINIVYNLISLKLFQFTVSGNALC